MRNLLHFWKPNRIRPFLSESQTAWNPKDHCSEMYACRDQESIRSLRHCVPWYAFAYQAEMASAAPYFLAIPPEHPIQWML